MKVLNIGSMNLDLVYSVDHIVQPGGLLANRFYDNLKMILLLKH